MVRPTSSCRFPLSSTKALLHLSLLLGLCGAFAAFLPTAASAAGAGPVASYSFDEGSGETVEDLSGNGHTATIHGAEWTTHGKYGGAMEFHAEAEDFVSIPASTSLDGNEELTVEAWVRPTATPEFSSILMKEREGSGPRYSYALYQHKDQTSGYFHESEEGILISPEHSLPSATWTHLTITDDGSASRLYVNGQLVDTKPALPIEGHGEIRLGGNGIWGEYFDGRIDEVRIYDRALSAAEVGLDMETPLATPKAGPVAAWSFDEGKGTTAADLTGHGHTATISKATWTHGRFGNGLKFDGKNSCVTVPNSPELNFTEEMTLEAWVRPLGSKEEGDPLIMQTDEAEGPTEEGFVYDLLAAPKAWVRKAGSGYQGVYGTKPLPGGTWSHVTLTDDGANLRLYVDGELVRTAPAPTLTTGTGPLQIGCDIWNDHFEGRIDEVRLYNRALTTAEVGTDMEAPVQTPKTGPVAEYSFDEGSGETAEDLTGNGHTATLQGAEWTTHGRYGGALEFHAEDEDFVSIPASTSLDGNEELTVEAWVRPTAAPEFGTILAKEREGSGPKYSYALLQHKELPLGYFMEKEESGYVDGGAEGSLPRRSWTHLAMTDDGAHSRLYVNGKLVDTELAVPIEGHGEIRLGGNDIWGQYFDGRIDEVRIYDRSLDAAEVDADMETPLQTPKAGPVADYSFDEANEETQADTSGNGHTATVEGAKWTSHGRYGGAMEFDGENDQLTIPDSPDLRLSEEFTLEAWVRPNQIRSLMPVVAKVAAKEDGYALYASDGNEPPVPQGFLTEGEHVHGYAYSENVLDPHTWAHLAVTFDGAHIRFFVNGVLVDTRPAEELPIGKGPLTIGGVDPFPEGGFFDGRIDEIRVYNRSLNEAEISTDMAAPIQTPQQGPIAAWSFDEVGEGGTVEDLTGDGHTGTVEGATLARGKYGQALQFDGENDVVKVPNSPEFALTEGFTLESWVRPESGSNEWAPILAKEMGGGEAATQLAWWLYEAGEHANEPYGGTEPKAGENDHAESDDPLPVDAWSHVALTWDGSKVRLYVNGELVDCSPVVPAGAPPVTEGELQIGGATEHGDYYKGRLDEVRVYNRALGKAEIQQSMTTTFPVAVTTTVEEVESNDALMTGTAQGRGEGTEYFFEYGPTTSYGSVATGEEIESNSGPVPVEEVAIGLAPETTYHYRLVVEGSLGTAYGKDQTFTSGARTRSVEEEEAEAGEEEAPLEGEESSELFLSPLAKGEVGKFFGVDWSGSISRMVNKGSFNEIAESGAQTVRFVVAENGEMDQAFKAAFNHGLTSLPYLGQGGFIRNDTEAGREARKHFLEFTENMIRAYGPGTKYNTETWEIWNEPNMPHPINPDADPLVYESDTIQGNVRPAEFAVFYKEIVETIRSVIEKESAKRKEEGKGPLQIHILAPGLFGYKSTVGGHWKPRAFMSVFNKVMKDEPALANPYGGISLHPYVFKTRLPKGEGKKVGPAHAPNNEPDAKQVRKEIKAEITELQNLEKQSGQLGKTTQIWVTELGFPVKSEAKGKTSTKIPPVSEPEQNLLLRATFSMLRNAPERLQVERAMYYNIEDLGGESWEHHCGLFNGYHNPRPSWASFTKLAGG